VSDVVVEQGRWAPVSAGEYDRRTRKISVNLTVVEQVHATYGHDPARVIAAIVAHERVHVTSTPDTLPHEDEARAHAAAVDAAGADIVTHIDDVLAGAWV
jgi:hypothetical protein